MHYAQVVEGLQGVEVIVDDFIIARFSNNDGGVNNSLKKCHLWNLKLNHDRVKQHQSSMEFMGHLFTSQGLRPGTEKIQAKLQMPEPKDLTALKRFLGRVTYLAKFMPHPSEVTVPLRCLEDKNVELHLLPQHALTMNTIKKYPTEAPVLCYYDKRKPVPVKCNTSQSGLGAVLLQDGQPDCYASRALTPTESQYEQEIVPKETDHEPLKSVFKKEIHKSPKGLQRMCLALQKYNVEVQCKKGTTHIADALSQALSEDH